MRWWTVTALCAALALAAFDLPQAGADDDSSDVLPDKRYVAALARNGELPLYTGWRKKQLHGNKRYLPRYNKRAPDDGAADSDTDIEELLEEIAATEQLRHLQLDALRRELDAQEAREEAAVLEAGDGDEDYEKRSLASLARAGDLARHGKRNIAAMAKNGLLGAAGPVLDADKRGGIASLARAGQLGKRDGDGDGADSLDDLMEQLYEEEGKRNVGSLARNFALPSYGKRNLGALAKSGGFSNLRYLTAKKNDDDDITRGDEQKRSFAQVDKRYLASLVRTHGLPYPVSKKEGDEPGEIKRNVGALARNWMLPSAGKRADEEDEEIAKRYLASVLRQGRSEEQGHQEEKRHVGSLAKGGVAIHKKTSRSAGSDGPAYLQQQAADNASGAEPAKRAKRQAYYLPAPPQPSDEFPMPVLQNSADLYDYEDLLDIMSGGLPAPEKRFMGVPSEAADYGKRHIGALARLGWLPSFRAASPGRSGRSGRIGKRAVSPRSHPPDGPEQTPPAAWWPTKGAVPKYLSVFLV